MNLTDGWQRQTHINIRLSCSKKSQVYAKGEANDPNSISTDLRVVLEQMECRLLKRKPPNNNNKKVYFQEKNAKPLGHMSDV